MQSVPLSRPPALHAILRVTSLQQVRAPALHAILQCYTLLQVRVHVRVDARSCGSVRSVVSIPPPLAATAQPHDIRSNASQYCSC